MIVPWLRLLRSNDFMKVYCKPAACFWIDDVYRRNETPIIQILSRSSNSFDVVSTGRNILSSSRPADQQITFIDVCHGLTLHPSAATLHSLQGKHHESRNTPDGRQAFHKVRRLHLPMWPWYSTAAGDGDQSVFWKGRRGHLGVQPWLTCRIQRSSHFDVGITLCGKVFIRFDEVELAPRRANHRLTHSLVVSQRSAIQT